MLKATWYRSGNKKTTGPVGIMIAYNVFQSREKGIYCAVPEDQPVPSFIVGQSWEFSDKCGEDHLPKTAPEGIRFSGFFIFHPFETDKLAA